MLSFTGCLADEPSADEAPGDALAGDAALADGLPEAGRSGFAADPASALPLDAGQDAGPAPDAAGPASALPLDAGQEDAGQDAGPAPDAFVAADSAVGDAAVAVSDVPTLTLLRDELFIPSCSLGRCHVTSAPLGGLSLTGRRIPVYDALVNVPSQAVPERLLVVPFEPETSYIIEKLTSENPAAGLRMPPMVPLEPAQIDRLRAWIAAGAPNN